MILWFALVSILFVILLYTLTLEQRIKVIGSKSNKPVYILPGSTLETQKKKADLLDYLRTVADALAPGTDFTLSEYDGDTFTYNKKDMYLCLRNAEFDKDTLVFVFLHELTHILCQSCNQHESPFYDRFYTLLDQAKLSGFYNETSRLYPFEFCGQKVQEKIQPDYFYQLYST